MKTIQAKKGSVIAVQNSENKGFFYIVKSGVLEVDSEHKFKDKALSIFEPGDTLGLVSALTVRKFLVTIYARTDAVIIEIPIAKLGEYLATQRKIAIKMLARYTLELRTIHKYLSLANEPEYRYHSPEKLFYDAQQYIALEKPHYALYALKKFLPWAQQNKPELVEKAKQQIQGLGQNDRSVDWQSNLSRLQRDRILFLENESSQEIYVVKEGSVKLFKVVKSQELVIDILGQGEIFGEMAFIDQSYRMASAVTDSDSIILRFTKDTLFDDMGNQILQKIFEGLARRIWFSHQRLEILRISEPLDRLYTLIYSIMRNYEVKNREDFSDHERIEINISLEELKKMSGLSRVKPERIDGIMKDSNLDVKNKSIIISNRKRLLDRVSGHRTLNGQITAS